MAEGSEFENRLFEDLGQCGVYVEDVVRELVDGLAEHHRLQQRLQEQGGLGADDVRSEELAGVARNRRYPLPR